MPGSQLGYAGSNPAGTALRASLRVALGEPRPGGPSRLPAPIGQWLGRLPFKQEKTDRNRLGEPCLPEREDARLGTGRLRRLAG